MVQLIHLFNETISSTLTMGTECAKHVREVRSIYNA